MIICIVIVILKFNHDYMHCDSRKYDYQSYYYYFFNQSKLVIIGLDCIKHHFQNDSIPPPRPLECKLFIR